MTSPYRPLPVLAREPRQTWWGRFALVRRWLGGRWELRGYMSVVMGVTAWTRWIRVEEHSLKDEWREPGMMVLVLGRQYADGRVSWCPAMRAWGFSSFWWNRGPSRRTIGGRWERWSGSTTATLGEMNWGTITFRSWVAVNHWTTAAERPPWCTVLEHEWYPRPGDSCRRPLVFDHPEIEIHMEDDVEQLPERTGDES